MSVIFTKFTVSNARMASVFHDISCAMENPTVPITRMKILDVWKYLKGIYILNDYINDFC